MRVAIYARYSSDLQNDASIDDQMRQCNQLAHANGWHVTKCYDDRGLSGASHLRPGFQQLMQDARSGLFDTVVAEGLDRLSRDQEHIAGFHKQMQFLGIPIVTVAEGDISELHIGLKGTMSSLFLKDLALKTRRGLEGRVRQGKSAGGITYGYDVVRRLNDRGEPTTGERQINEEQASIVRRIFHDYAVGKSPRAIAAELNAEHVPCPRGQGWGASTIHGNWRRGTGILNNELYIGKLVWNRQHFIKDPATGKRQARLNPTDKWIIKPCPDLRIIDNALWQKVKDRQGVHREHASDQTGMRPERARRPRYLFSGLIKCGECGGGYTLVGKAYYGCANRRNNGTCSNHMSVRRDLLEERVLEGLRCNMLHPELMAEFVKTYHEELNKLLKEQSSRRLSLETELKKVKDQTDRIVLAIADGSYHSALKDKLTDLEDRKIRIELELASLEKDSQPIRIHPGIEAIYQQKVQDLTTSLNDPALREEAMLLIRSLLVEIRLIPEEEGLALELIGELAALLTLADQKQTARSVSPSRSLSMVAGAGFEPATFRL